MKDDKEKKSDPKKAPKPEIPQSNQPVEESENPVVNTIPILAELERQGREIKLLEKKVDFISNTNWLMVVVLAVGFIVLLITVAGIIITVVLDFNNSVKDQTPKVVPYFNSSSQNNTPT